jgi:hypothetical protein
MLIFLQNNKWSANSFDKNIVNSSDSQKLLYTKYFPLLPKSSRDNKLVTFW